MAKKDLKVKPGDKKKDEKLRNKAKSLILNHPEVLYNVRNLFHNQNGETIVEEIVPRGDESEESVIMPRNQGDLKEKDLQDILKGAKKLIDETLKQYDEKVAMEDALTKAIGTVGDGKYSGKINACTYKLLLDELTSKSKKASDINDNDKEAFRNNLTPMDFIALTGIDVSKIPNPVMERIMNKFKDFSENLVELFENANNPDMMRTYQKAGMSLRGVLQDQETIMEFINLAKKGGRNIALKLKNAFPKVTMSISEPDLRITERSHVKLADDTKESRMDKAVLQKEIEATQKKLAALKVLAGDEDVSEKEASEKEAGKGSMKCKKCGKGFPAFMKECPHCKKGGKKDDKDKDEDGDDKGKEDGKGEKKRERKGKTAAERVLIALDEIADTLEKQNDPELTKLAFEIDTVSDSLEEELGIPKQAKTLQSDSDEPYMKNHFKAGVIEKDSDEKFMDEFNTDTSAELDEKFEGNKLGKDAADLPYQKVK